MNSKFFILITVGLLSCSRECYLSNLQIKYSWVVNNYKKYRDSMRCYNYIESFPKKQWKNIKKDSIYLTKKYISHSFFQDTSAQYLIVLAYGENFFDYFKYDIKNNKIYSKKYSVEFINHKKAKPRFEKMTNREKNCLCSTLVRLWQAGCN